MINGRNHASSTPADPAPASFREQGVGDPIETHRERGWFLVVIVASFVIVVSLLGTWRGRREPLPRATAAELEQIYRTNLAAFAQTCEGRAGDPDFDRVRAFCRQQATLLSLLSLCDADCQRRVGPFVGGEATR